MCQLTEAYTANAELSQIGMRSSADLTTGISSGGKLGSSLLLSFHCLFCHDFVPPCLLCERCAEECQQFLCFLVCLCRCDKVDIHTSNLIDLIVLNLREDQLFLDTGGVVALTVEGIAVDATEVTYTREADIEQLVYELVHSL